ncbi:MAG: hypothetical protein ABI548_21890 [Polyangiaceae bacterium]
MPAFRPRGRSSCAAFPVPGGGGFIGIGDVAGHGLTSGLVMLMAQSVVGALGRR